MEIVVLSIGKLSFPWIKDGVKEYESRLIKYAKFQSIELPDIKGAKTLSKDKIKEEEGNLIIKELKPSDLVVILDERGQTLTSVEFANWIEKKNSSGKKRMVFVIGGPFGFDKKVYDRADIMIRLSSMTFTHEMARLILIEQIYRAMTILKGEPYHHV